MCCAADVVWAVSCGWTATDHAFVDYYVCPFKVRTGGRGLIGSNAMFDGMASFRYVV